MLIISETKASKNDREGPCPPDPSPALSSPVTSPCVGGGPPQQGLRGETEADKAEACASSCSSPLPGLWASLGTRSRWDPEGVGQGRHVGTWGGACRGRAGWGVWTGSGDREAAGMWRAWSSGGSGLGCGGHGQAWELGRAFWGCEGTGWWEAPEEAWAVSAWPRQYCGTAGPGGGPQVRAGTASLQSHRGEGVGKPWVLLAWSPCVEAQSWDPPSSQAALLCRPYSRRVRCLRPLHLLPFPVHAPRGCPQSCPRN